LFEDENGNLIGVKREIEIKNKESVEYNTRTTIDYQNKDYKICDLALPIQKFNKGIYTVSVYSDI
ncbi:MAG: hypothetical protein AAGK97_17910, partial [Bacteroidota bacterium]